MHPSSESLSSKWDRFGPLPFTFHTISAQLENQIWSSESCRKSEKKSWNWKGKPLHRCLFLIMDWDLGDNWNAKIWIFQSIVFKQNSTQIWLWKKNLYKTKYVFASMTSFNGFKFSISSNFHMLELTPIPWGPCL